MAELSERKLLIGFVLLLVMGISAAVLAIQQAKPRPVTPLDQLPLATHQYGNPSPDRCQAAGGTVGYDRTTECYSQPEVTDACGFGVPCFIDGNGNYCREVRSPYCVCTKDSQCPSPLVCVGRVGGPGRCQASNPSVPPPPIR